MQPNADAHNEKNALCRYVVDNRRQLLQLFSTSLYTVADCRPTLFLCRPTNPTDEDRVFSLAADRKMARLT